MKNRVADRILTLLEEEDRGCPVRAKAENWNCYGKESQWSMPSRNIRPKARCGMGGWAQARRKPGAVDPTGPSHKVSELLKDCFLKNFWSLSGTRK